MDFNQDKYFWYESFKKPFIIYNRSENNNLAKEPVISDCTQRRDCFLFDNATRSLFKQDAFCNNKLLVGNTYFGSIGKHNETHNDYNNNKVDGGGSYGTVLGTSNILNYNNNGGFVAGRYNSPNTSYLFTIGNGKSENSRSNLVQATDSTLYINGDLEVNGTKFSDIANNFNESDASIQIRLSNIEEKLNQLLLELQNITVLTDNNK